MSWKRHACVNTLHFSISQRLSLNVTHTEKRTNICLLIISRTVSLPQIIYNSLQAMQHTGVTNHSEGRISKCACLSTVITATRQTFAGVLENK